MADYWPFSLLYLWGKKESFKSMRFAELNDSHGKLRAIQRIQIDDFLLLLQG